MKLLITGGAGFIGSAVVRKAVRDGHAVVNLDKLTYAVVQGRADKDEGIFASLEETEPETVSMMFLDSAFYERSVAFWPPHIRQAQGAGEISTTIDVGVATDFIMRLAVTLVLFPHMGVELKNRDEVRAYLAQVVRRGLGPAKTDEE